MAKFVALKETLDGGKIIAAGAVVEGKDLDKLNPKLFRKANAQESLTATENKTVITDKQIAKVLEQVKARSCRAGRQNHRKRDGTSRENA